LCGIAAAAAAEVYKWTDEDGAVHYGDSPPEDKGKGESSDVVQMETEDVDTRAKWSV